ncbi:helix-turn-helix transcriptional regulator [Paraburkholderia sp. CNPSo 3272]|uniref:helix-turn-helix domain-containing protein n=1 Tax=Paraburkholderia sp. CNPSo 3272 TaxID=2940931 RepID=UPI0020B80CC3|nr:helix-turn-helix transcriptional regulator [Paraburkholderia sp. CNPSo 3272]MCP3728067.1 helix-turn-helix transcriptional regulator [Paraburkholderia sp. CNPSo 3272]
MSGSNVSAFRVRISVEVAMPSDGELSKVITSIYDAAVEPERWPTALERVVGFLGAMHAHLWEGDAKERLRSVGWAGTAPRFVQAYDEHYVRMDPFALARTWPSGTILTDPMMAPRAVIERSEFFQDWARPQGMNTAVGTNVALDGGNVAVLVATRRQRDGNFDQEHLDLLAGLLPHFQRALRMNLHLCGMDLVQHTASAALDALSHAVLIVDTSCHVMFANRVAEEFLSSADGIGSGPLGLFAMTTTLTNSLRSLVARATAVGKDPPTGSALALSRTSMKRPYQALISPLAVDAARARGVSRKPAALILVVDPERVPDSAERRLRTLYNLTRIEARVACEIHKGASLDAVAESLNVQQSTVRTHLHHIFQKTEARRQSDLVRLIEQMSGLLDNT